MMQSQEADPAGESAGGGDKEEQNLTLSQALMSPIKSVTTGCSAAGALPDSHSSAKTSLANSDTSYQPILDTIYHQEKQSPLKAQSNSERQA